MPASQHELPFGGPSAASLPERAAAALEAFQLNEQQRAAVEHTGGPLIVLAGPGTGKTRVLTARILRLLRDGADPGKILALTFTIKAAREMRERLAAQLGDAASEVRLVTFHALAWGLVARFPDVLGLPAEVRLRDSAETKRLIRSICRRERLFAFRAGEGHAAIAEPLAAFIHDCRSLNRSPAEALAFAERWSASVREADPADPEARGAMMNALQFADAARLYELFDRESRALGLVGYDDSLTMACELLGDDRFVGPLVRSENRHVLVDEFQDVNPAQIALLRALAPAGSGAHGGAPDVMVVGDDDQAIYAFRGANAAAFDRFVSGYADAERGACAVHRQRLEINYRSRPSVIRVGQSVIERAGGRFDPDKSLRADPGVPEDEADADASVEGYTITGNADEFGPLVLALIERDRAASSRGYESYAVIARSNVAADRVAQALRLAGVPVDRRHKREATDNPGVQDLLAWIELLVDPGNAAAAQRLLVRPPILAPPERVSRWLSMYARAHLEGGVGVDSDGADAVGVGARGFFEWLRAVDAELPSGVRHAAETADRLAVAARTQTADKVIESLIHESGIVHTAETPADRLELVTDLAAMIRFVRGRLAHLEAPGDLAAFWSYFNDLDRKDRAFDLGGGGDESDEPPTPATEIDDVSGDGASSSGVTVVTAHSAKGLEFDTVFVVDVRPPYGFPKTSVRPRERFEFPDGFSGESESDLIDEERRLFYVACTRAQRRLVLLAKFRKTVKSSSTDFFLELTHERPELGVVVGEAGPVLDAYDGGGDGGVDPVLSGDGDPLRERLRNEARRERYRAFAALHEAEDAGADEARLVEIADRLGAHARALAALRLVERSGGVDAEAALSGLGPEGRARVAGLLGGPAGVVSPFRPMRAPLRLSYSVVSSYLRCPRCFWIAQELRLDSGLSPELLLGSAVHETLEAHFKAVRRAESGESEDGVHVPGVEQSMKSARRRLLSRLPAHMPPDADLLERAESMVRTAIVDMHDAGTQILEIERKFEIPYCTAADPGTRHTITGKIDRLDQLPDGTLRIVDYKTGRPRSGLVSPTKKDHQLGVYAMALHELYGDAPAVGEYWLLGTKERGRLGLETIDLASVRGWLDGAIEGMLAGSFPRGEKCDGPCGLLDLDVDLG